ncbi:hypothetical protein D9619_006730 [Psilocybe cf. subviscida]|uniref:Uncharacterized protein n=1 Tax=Psilocybe cf. subviscida TaxID=2480587 RepID=A0A8H5EY81_9AGAR|nr:hypothetical protein D9619_006730 [Psilocybe cf. subviscida]
MSSAAMSKVTEAMTIMSPDTTRICLTAFEATKDWCLDVPNIDAIKAELLRFYHEVVLQHPYISAAILLLWAFYPLAPFQFIWFFVWVIPKSIVLGILTCLGFEREGVRSDSIASRYQSRRYGAHTPGHSYLSGAQSYGAINHVHVHDVESLNSRRTDARPHPIASFFRGVLRLLLVYAVIVLLLQYGARQK